MREKEREIERKRVPVHHDGLMYAVAEVTRLLYIPHISQVISEKGISEKKNKVWFRVKLKFNLRFRCKIRFRFGYF